MRASVRASALNTHVTLSEAILDHEADRLEVTGVYGHSVWDRNGERRSLG